MNLYRSVLWTLLVATLAGIPAAYLVAEKPKAPLPAYGAVADFTLTERSGHAVSLEDLKEKLWVGDFVFSNCPGQCPMVTHQMSRLQKLLPSTIRLVSFTVDPDRDTPEKLAKYAEGYGADRDRWFFLTGNKETLNNLAVSFHMNTIEDPMLHSIRLVLVDRRAQIRGYYDATDEEAVKKLLADAATLLRENKRKVQ